MLELIAAPDHVAAYRLSGTLMPADYDRLVADIEARLKRHEKVGVLVDLTGFEDITIKATASDLRYGFSKLFELKRFPRQALISDKSWVAAVAAVASPLVPFMEIRAFGSGALDAALTWVGDIEGGPNA